MFVETRFKPLETHSMPTHACIHRNDCVLNQRHPYGSTVFIKHNLLHLVTILFAHVDNIMAGDRLESFLDMVGITFKSKTIIFQHKSPAYPLTKFADILCFTITQFSFLQEVTIVGDFNLHPSTVNKIFHNTSFKYCLIEDETTDYGTLIDLCYTNQHNQSAHVYVYESPISDHKALFFLV